MIKLSAADWCFFLAGTEPARYYARLAELGYGGAEMVDPSRFAVARAAGLELVNIGMPDLYVGLNRREHHPQLIPAIRDTIKLAGDQGVGQVIVFSGARQGQPDAEGIENCRRGLEALLPEAERHGVTLVFEMLNLHDHPDYQAVHGDYGFKLARELGSPHLKLIYDVYHMARMGDDPAPDLVANLDLVAHLHLAESPGRGLPQKDGAINYGRIVPPVVAAGYAGYWGMEFVPAGDPFDELGRAARLFRDLAGG